LSPRPFKEEVKEVAADVEDPIRLSLFDDANSTMQFAKLLLGLVKLTLYVIYGISALLYLKEEGSDEYSCLQLSKYIILASVLGTMKTVALLFQNGANHKKEDEPVNSAGRLLDGLNLVLKALSFAVLVWGTKLTHGARPPSTFAHLETLCLMFNSLCWFSVVSKFILFIGSLDEKRLEP